MANRTEARDFIDLASLMSHSSIRRLFELACRKQPGLTPGQVLYGLEQFDKIPRSELELTDPEIEQLRMQVGTWHKDLQELTRHSIRIRTRPASRPSAGIPSTRYRQRYLL